MVCVSDKLQFEWVKKHEELQAAFIAYHDAIRRKAPMIELFRQDYKQCLAELVKASKRYHNPVQLSQSSNNDIIERGSA